MISNFFDRRSAKKDVAAGLTLAVESVPDGMAVGTLAAISTVEHEHFVDEATTRHRPKSRARE